MGRKNYEGFSGFWPSVAADPGANPRDRDLATWLDTTRGSPSGSWPTRSAR